MEHASPLAVSQVAKVDRPVARDAVPAAGLATRRKPIMLLPADEVDAMQIDVRKEGDVSILEISGRMTIGKPELALRECFSRLLDSGERRFVFDLSAVTHLDSAGIGETLACSSRARENNAELKVVAPPRGRTRRDFLIADLDKVLDIFPDEETALRSFDG